MIRCDDADAAEVIIQSRAGGLVVHVWRNGAARIRWATNDRETTTIDGPVAAVAARYVLMGPYLAPDDVLPSAVVRAVVDCCDLLRRVGGAASEGGAS